MRSDLKIQNAVDPIQSSKRSEHSAPATTAQDSTVHNWTSKSRRDAPSTVAPGTFIPATGFYRVLKGMLKEIEVCIWTCIPGI